MKAYLFITGTIFGLMALLHLLKGIDERAHFSSEPGHYIFMAFLGILAAALSVWAWRLLRRLSQPPQPPQPSS